MSETTPTGSSSNSSISSHFNNYNNMEAIPPTNASPDSPHDQDNSRDNGNIDNCHNNNNAINPLPQDFTVGDDDVIIGWKSRPIQHVGNESLRMLVESMLDDFNRSPIDTSLQKAILTKIVEYVKSKAVANGGGGFVKLDSKTWRWWSVGDVEATQKVSEMFRDALKLRNKKHPPPQKQTARQAPMKKRKLHHQLAAATAAPTLWDSQLVEDLPNLATSSATNNNASMTGLTPIALKAARRLSLAGLLDFSDTFNPLPLTAGRRRSSFDLGPLAARCSSSADVELLCRLQAFKEASNKTKLSRQLLCQSWDASKEGEEASKNVPPASLSTSPSFSGAHGMLRMDALSLSQQDSRISADGLSKSTSYGLMMDALLQDKFSGPVRTDGYLAPTTATSSANREDTYYGSSGTAALAKSPSFSGAFMMDAFMAQQQDHTPSPTTSRGDDRNAQDKTTSAETIESLAYELTGFARRLSMSSTAHLACS